MWCSNIVCAQFSESNTVTNCVHSKSLSSIDNATPGFILSLEKLSERVPELNWFKIESMMSVRALETKWRILGTHCIVGFY